ncbi:MAG: NUDIX hydrolase [Lachnospiraceae bacterium]
MTEEEFLKNYDASKYPKPSVTVDMLIFTMNEANELEVLLIQRGGHPFLGKWAIPGGFVNMKESLEEAAARELQEETGLCGIYLEQLYTFGAVDRDPRMRVISVVYLALVPKNSLHIVAGDDAAQAQLFRVNRTEGKIGLESENRCVVLQEEDLAFDHAEILRTGLERLQGKMEYSNIALELLRDKKRFSIYELQKIYEAVGGKELDVANFRRNFRKRYIDTGLAEKTEEKCYEYSKRPSNYYRLLN